MKKLRKEDIQQEVFDLYDDYAHNKIDRRNFMNKLSVYAVGGMTVSSLAALLLPNYAEGQQVNQGDPRIVEEIIDKLLDVINRNHHHHIYYELIQSNIRFFHQNL